MLNVITNKSIILDSKFLFGTLKTLILDLLDLVNCILEYHSTANNKCITIKIQNFQLLIH